MAGKSVNAAKAINVLVTGANGQLGRELTALTVPGVTLHGAGRQELDVTRLDQCRSAVAKARADVVIHAAAYTAVDAAENAPDEAFRVNAGGTRNIAIAAQEAGAALCYISTDYVFDGKSGRPYQEYDSLHPQSEYGKSKLAGEVMAQTLCSRPFIVRTSWVYGKHGHNFVKTMLKLGRERTTLSVVQDQFGSPTYAKDLAAWLIKLVRTERYGIYHASNAGACNWFDFATAIFHATGMPVTVEPCTTAQYPRPAPRPAYSVMDHAAIRWNGLDDLRHWKDALHAFLEEEDGRMC